MTSHPEALDQMLAIWNCCDHDEISRLANAIFEPDFHFIDPNYDIIGPAAFIDMVHAVQAEIPGAVYSRAGGVDSHHNLYRYHWAIHLGAQLIMPGFDVSEVNPAGKIVKVIGFFGELK